MKDNIEFIKYMLNSKHVDFSTKQLIREYWKQDLVNEFLLSLLYWAYEF